MRSKQGFSLVEILVGIGLVCLLLGCVTMLWRDISVSMRTGMNQQEAYEEARVFMERITSTLKYADRVGELPKKRKDSFTYSGQTQIHQLSKDDEDTQKQKYRATLQYIGSRKKMQLQLKLEYWTPDADTENDKPEHTEVLLYPRNVQNSPFAFTQDAVVTESLLQPSAEEAEQAEKMQPAGDAAVLAVQLEPSVITKRQPNTNEWAAWVEEHDGRIFPIALQMTNGVTLYEVVLPFRYGAMSNSAKNKQAEKVTILRASVRPAVLF